MKDKEVVSISLDPLKETADINTANNSWPSFAEPSKFQLFKNGAGWGPWELVEVEETQFRKKLSN